jgi:hypothetical protein
MPTKHTTVARSMLGVGAALLRILDRPLTVSGLWDAAKSVPAIGSYQRFLLGLDLLYVLGAVELRGGRMRRAGQ